MPTLRLLSYNIRNGGTGREALLRETIERIRPDIAVFTEVGRRASFETIAAVVGDHRLIGSSPFSRARTAVVSRFPFVESARYGPWWAPRKWVDVVVRPFDGPALNVHGIYLFPHQLWACELWRRREIHRMLRHVQARAWLPQALVGDFNAIARNDAVRRASAPWWIHLQWWSQAGVIPRLALKPLMQAGYIDSFRTCHSSAEGFTIRSDRPNARIDYIFTSADLQDQLKGAEVVATNANGRAPSDHLPLWVDVEWPRE